MKRCFGRVIRIRSGRKIIAVERGINLQRENSMKFKVVRIDVEERKERE